MRTEVDSRPAPEHEELVIPGACASCEGPLAVRVTPGTTRGYCRACGWISRPLVWHVDGQVAVAYPPVASA